ncbi:MAG: hypothetical protein ACKESC_01545 [Candidatus Hodgkinia cicadicola]
MNSPGSVGTAVVAIQTLTPNQVNINLNAKNLKEFKESLDSVLPLFRELISILIKAMNHIAILLKAAGQNTCWLLNWLWPRLEPHLKCALSDAKTVIRTITNTIWPYLRNLKIHRR